MYSHKGGHKEYRFRNDIRKTAHMGTLSVLQEAQAHGCGYSRSCIRPVGFAIICIYPVFAI